VRILHFLDTTNRGGAETQVLDICRNARDYGFEMTFVTAQGGTLEPEFRDSGVDFVRLGRRFPIDLYLASQLRRIIRERQIAVVHGYQAVEGLHLYLATRGLKNIKRVLSFQGGTVYDWKNRRTLRFLIPRMDANVVVSEGLKRHHAETDRLDTSNFTVIHNGADPVRLRPSGKQLRHELGLGDETRLVGMVGNFYREKRKDQLTFCRSLPAVFAEFPEVHCVFAGKVEPGAEGKFADCLEFCLRNGIADRVHFLGGRSDIPDVLAALDVFVLASFREGLPVAVSEAMLAGVPAVLSDIEPLIEASDQGRCAELFRTGDAGELSKRLVRLLGDEDARTVLARAGAEHANANFSIAAHLESLRLLYNSLV
jgi:glycosyltransferase involved in cell wall biosynthesis